MPASSTGCASGAEIYLHFASQASFERADSTWANQHRTSYADVERWWQGRARLLPPYTTLTLSDLAHQSTPAAAYRPAAAARRSMRTEERLSEESAAVIDAADTARLQRKLNLWRWLLWPLFPRGFAFEAGDKALVYDPRRGRCGSSRPAIMVILSFRCRRDPQGSSRQRPSQRPRHYHVRPHPALAPDRPAQVYGLFVLFQFDDYGHMRRPGAMLRWIGCGLRRSFPSRLPAP